MKILEKHAVKLGIAQLTLAAAIYWWL